MTITLYSCQPSAASSGGRAVYGGGHTANIGKTRTLSELFQTIEGNNMTTLITQFAEAKAAYILGGNQYADAAANMVAEHGTNAAAYAKTLVTVLNADYPVADCKDNPDLKTALNSCQKAVKRAGEALPDGIGGKLVFRFSTATDAGEKIRTVSAEYLTPSQLAIMEEREKADAAIAASRAEEDMELQSERVRMELLQLTALDVFLRVNKDIAETYPDHDIREILAAGMAWINKQDNDKQDSDNERKTA